MLRTHNHAAKHYGLIGPPGARVWPGRLKAAAGLIRFWAERRRTRRALAELGDDQLKDVGLTRAQAKRESVLPFWHAYTPSWKP